MTDRTRPTARYAFTLIELLVVITIITLLISILLPGLKGARATAYKTREMAAAQQKLVAWAGYAGENKDAAFTGYIPWAVAHLGGTASPRVWLHPDPWNPTYRTEGNVIKVNGLRWMGATGMPLDALMVDRRTADDFRARPNTATYNSGGMPPTTLYDGDVGSLAAAMAYHPSLGLNSTYVGGSWHRGAFPTFATGVPGAIGHPRPKWYVTETAEIRRTSMLMVFCSARGVDIKTTGGFSSTNYGRNAANWTQSSIVVPGFWEVTPPAHPTPPHNGSGNQVINWTASNVFQELTNPSGWGFTHPRHGGRAVTVMADGHVEMLSLPDLRDMRRWANHANRPDWTFTPNN